MYRRLLIVGAVWALSLPALAHEAKGPHGGRMADAGPYHVELVSNGKQLDLFVADTADRPVPPDGFRGVAILIVDGKSQRIPLDPVDKKLSGTSGVSLPADPKGVIQLTLPGGKTAQTRFN